jgi:hypothetical protein
MKSGPNKTSRIILWGSSLPVLLAASVLYFPFCKTGPVLCPTALLFGLPCPGCGLTRALGHATHGLFREAFDYHALWPLLLAYFVFVWVYKIIESARGEPPKLPTDKIGGGALLVMLGFWVVRIAWFFAHDGLAIIKHDNGIARLIRLFS